MPASTPTNLRQALAEAFSLDEMDVLCADLGIDPEHIPYRERGKEIKANWVVIFLQKRNDLARLIEYCSRQRPAMDWANLPIPDLTSDDLAVLEGAVVVQNITIAADQAHNVSGLANPYLGLSAFTYADRDIYAGREREIAEAITRLASPGRPTNLLFITGASGSGKSSFVQAGLLPALEAHYTQRHLETRKAICRPSLHPIPALDDALQQLGKADLAVLSGVKLLVIDQFEEIFTQADSHERSAFLDWLAGLPQFGEAKTHVIVTVRSDYLDDLAEIAVLWPMVKDAIVLRAMSVDELKQAIQHPLQQRFANGERRFEPSLVDKLAQDAHGNAAYLPLLQVTLAEIWKRGSLMLANYSGLADAITQRADAVYAFEDFDASTPNHPRTEVACAAITDLFLNLINVSLDDDARRDVRISRDKRLLTQSVISDTPEQPNAGPINPTLLIDDLTRARLLTVTNEANAEVINIIHEALITNWVRLRESVRERRERLQQRVRFEQQVRDWLANGQSDDYLLGGVYLAQARELARVGDIATQSAQARELLQLSIERTDAELNQQQAEREAQQRRELLAAEQAKRIQEREQANQRLRRRAWFLASLLALAIVLATSTAGLFVQSRNNAAEANRQANLAAEKAEEASAQRAIAVANEAEARRQAQIARSLKLALQSGSTNQLDLGLLLAVEARREDSTGEANAALFSSLQKAGQQPTSPNLYLRGHVSAVVDLAFSPDGKRLISADEGGTIIVWDVSGGQTPVKLGSSLIGQGSDVKVTIALSPMGDKAAVDVEEESIGLWDLRDPNAVTRLGLIQKSSTKPARLQFLSNGRILSIIDFDKSSNSTSIDLWNAEDITTPIFLNSVAFQGYDFSLSPDGSLFVSLTKYQYCAPRTCIEGDPLNRCVCSVVTNISLRDATDPQSPNDSGKLMDEQQAVSLIAHIAFLPNSKSFFALDSDGKISQWDISDSKLLKGFVGSNLEGHSAEINNLVLSQDGAKLASADNDGNVILWDVNESASLNKLGQLPRLHAARIRRMVFSPDGKILAAVGEDRTITLTNIDNLKSPLIFGEVTESGRDARNNTIVLSSDGGLLAIRRTIVIDSNAQSVIDLWDVNKPESPVKLSTLSFDISFYSFSMAFSLDNKTFVSGNGDGKVIFWNIEDVRSPKVFGQMNLLSNFATDLAYLSNDKLAIVFFTASAMYDEFDLECHFDGFTELSIWNVNGIKSPQTFQPTLMISRTFHNSTAYALDNESLVLADMVSGTISFWDLPNLRLSTSKPTLNMIPKTTSCSASGSSIGNVLSIDGKVAAMPNGNEEIRLWDLSIPSSPVELDSLKPGANRLSFSPNSRLLASVSRDEFDSSRNGVVNLWDISNPKSPIQYDAIANQIGTHISHAAFSPTKNALVTMSSDGRIVFSNMDMQSWETIACRIAHRNLTRKEWQRYLGEVPYRKTCPDLPADAS